MIFRFLFIFFASVFFSACDQTDSTFLGHLNSGCVTGSNGIAHIEIFDGSLMRVCGCAESNNAQFTNGQTLTCTLAAGTTLFFDFVGITVPHQMTIISVATTPVFSHSSSLPTQVYSIKLNSTGTFSFNDVFFPTLGGTLIVN